MNEYARIPFLYMGNDEICTSIILAHKHRINSTLRIIIEILDGYIACHFAAHKYNFQQAGCHNYEFLQSLN